VSDTGNGSRKGLDWRSRLTSLLLGAAGGMGVNLIGNDAGYRGVAASVVLAAILLATARLRALPDRPPIVRYSIWLLLILSLVAAVLAVVGSKSLAPYAVLVAAGLTVTTLLIIADPHTAITMLLGAASIGFGVAIIGFGVTVLINVDPLLGVAVIGLGVAFIGLGAAILINGNLLLGVADIGLGVAFIGLGAAILINGNLLAAVAIIGLGVAITGGGLAVLINGNLLAGAAIIGAGAAFTGGGLAILTNGNLLAGAAIIGAGAAAIGYGVPLLISRDSRDRLRRLFTWLTHEPASGPESEPADESARSHRETSEPAP